MTLKSKAMDRYDLEVKGYGRTDIYTPLAIFVPNMNTIYQKIVRSYKAIFDRAL